MRSSLACISPKPALTFAAMLTPSTPARITDLRGVTPPSPQLGHRRELDGDLGAWVCIVGGVTLGANK